MTFKELWRELHKINTETVGGKDHVYYEVGKDTACSSTFGDVVYSLYDGSSNFWEWCLNFIALRVGIFGSAIGYDKIADGFFIEQSREFDLTKKRVFACFSRGVLGCGVVVRYLLMCERNGVSPECKVILLCTPKMGGRRWFKHFKKICEKHNVEVIYITMVGDIVPVFVPWWKKQYCTRHIPLPNKEKGLKAKHQNVENYLPDEEVWPNV